MTARGFNLTTDRNYRDIELLVDYKTVPKADSGVLPEGLSAGADLGTTPTRPKFNVGFGQRVGRAVEQCSRRAGQGPRW